jgi:hypothetical protein
MKNLVLAISLFVVTLTGVKSFAYVTMTEQCSNSPEKKEGHKTPTHSGTSHNEPHKADETEKTKNPKK